ncbi:MAG TPA: sigma-70 family RNA polymerase sigma factor [Terriglobia bacterium]|nr:sigma-70 family RNA polymerase sigma factor [Terriglobia bacterium]
MKLLRIGISESDLLQKANQGDEEAFTLLYRRFQGPIYRYALQMSGSAELAEEVTQDVFMAVIKGETRFDPGVGTLGGYLVGIARNHLLRSKERNAKWVSIDEEEDQANYYDTLISSQDALSDLTNAQAIGLLQKGILGLPEHYREVVILCDLEELSYAEAAAALGCAVGTIRSRLHRAHAMLVKRLRYPEQETAVSPKLKPSRCLV